MEQLTRKFTILEGHNVVKSNFNNGRTVYLTKLTAAASLSRLLMMHEQDDADYGCTAEDVTIVEHNNTNQTASGILITFELDDKDQSKFLDMIVDYPYGTFISEWY